MSSERTVTVFGGTGFLGRRVVDALLRHGFAVRVASRHPRRDPPPAAESVKADVNDDRSVESALAGVFAAVNAVGLYVEQGDQTFESVHVEAAARVAAQARTAGLERLVHVSGIGADAGSSSSYIRSRGRGEGAVREAFPASTVMRPGAMFGPDDSFLNAVKGVLRRSRLFPMFGNGRTLLQPACVEDVAEAIARTLADPRPEPVYELGGPRILTYEELVGEVGRHLGVRPIAIPVPFPIWHALAFAAERLPSAPLTRNQVELMECNNVASPGHPGFSDLGIEPRDIDTVLATAG